MAEKNNAVCDICGESYYACLSCEEAMNLHPYKMYCCSANHFKVFQAVHGFSTGVYTKDEFKSKLKNIDLSDLESYRKHIKALIKDTLKENKTIVKTIEEAVAENVMAENVELENTENIEKMPVSRKKYYKTEIE